VGAVVVGTDVGEVVGGKSLDVGSVDGIGRKDTWLGMEGATRGWWTSD
jgi:hypothetical protein